MGVYVLQMQHKKKRKKIPLGYASCSCFFYRYPNPFFSHKYNLGDSKVERAERLIGHSINTGKRAASVCLLQLSPILKH